LLFKLEYGYNFDKSAIKLLENYFTNRKVKVKVNGFISQLYELSLGTGQGSVLGPLLFILFINDLPYYLVEFLTVLFADDTSLGMCGKSLEELLENFNAAIPKMNTWCKYNLIDINWKKTKIMFFTKQTKLKVPKTILIDNQSIDVVEFFELLGIMIDNKLNFNKYSCELRKTICTRLYSIKQLYYLKPKIRIQFLKTFILPHFDYGSTLYIYFSKEAIQRLCNTYNNCIIQMLNNDYTKSIIINENNEYNIYNNYLNEFNLQTFQHRLILRFSSYIFKILTNKYSPITLSKLLVKNSSREIGYPMRNAELYYVPNKLNNDNMEKTFQYFFSKFLNNNEIIRECIDKSEGIVKFKWLIRKEINPMFIVFISNFEKFDLKIKNFNYLRNP
jgi:hypothetical protein